MMHNFSHVSLAGNGTHSPPLLLLMESICSNEKLIGLGVGDGGNSHLA